MIWIKKRPKWNPGRVNQILSFGWIAFQWRVDDTTGMNGVVVDLIPGICIARNDWIYLGSELRWLIFTFSVLLTRPKLTEGLIQERDLMLKMAAEKRQTS